MLHIPLPTTLSTTVSKREYTEPKIRLLAYMNRTRTAWDQVEDLDNPGHSVGSATRSGLGTGGYFKL